MRQSVKKLWLKALRSGEYKQTNSALKDNRGFCCLGVLCDVHQKQMKKSKKKVDKWKVNDPDSGHSWYTKERTDLLPNKVAKWACLNHNFNNNYPVDPVINYGKSLSEMNDDGCSFKQIAKAIEKYL